MVCLASFEKESEWTVTPDGCRAGDFLTGLNGTALLQSISPDERLLQHAVSAIRLILPGANRLAFAAKVASMYVVGPTHY
jgi:hypothetical protein